MSDAEKRKKADDDAVSGSRKKAREVNGKEATAVTDDEVEEFYAIVRRIKTAVNYFKGGNDGDVEGKPSHSRWRRTLENEIIQEANDVKEEAKRVDNIEENGSFDLNTSPPPE